MTGELINACPVIWPAEEKEMGARPALDDALAERVELLDRPVAPRLRWKGPHLQADQWLSSVKAALRQKGARGGALCGGDCVGQTQAGVGHAERAGERKAHGYRVFALRCWMLDASRESRVQGRPALAKCHYVARDAQGICDER